MPPPKHELELQQLLLQNQQSLSRSAHTTRVLLTTGLPGR